MKYILQPQYADRFNCLASSCEESCCSGWKTGIEKSGIDKYQRLIEEKCPVRNNQSEKIQDEMNTNNNNSCPFWTNEKLCAIQNILGENKLPDTCFFFPRCINILGDKIELSLDLSCPYASGLALSKSDAMNLIKAEQNIKMAEQIHLSPDALEICEVQNIDPYFYKIRDFIFSLLKDRRYSLNDRLVIIGRLCCDLDYYRETGQWDNTIQKLLEDYNDSILKHKFNEYLEMIPKKTEVILPTIMNLIEHKIKAETVHSKLQICMQNIKTAIGYNEGCNMEEVIITYCTIQDEYYNDFVKNNEFVLENYFINIMFGELFPFGRRKNMQEQSKINSMFQMYFKLIFRYALLKCFLVGNFAVYKEKMRLEQVIETIQCFEKYIGHDVPYMDGIFAYFEANDVVTRPYANMLIKY